jgi:hypothetical protein
MSNPQAFMQYNPQMMQQQMQRFPPMFQHQMYTPFSFMPNQQAPIDQPQY